MKKPTIHPSKKEHTSAGPKPAEQHRIDVECREHVNGPLKTKPDTGILKELIRRIVEASQPEKIVLFGSAATGKMGPNSDIDVMVVKAGEFHRGRLTEEIYRSLWGLGCAVDVVVVTQDDIERYKDSFCLIIEPALREGIVVYDRASLAA